MFGNGRARILHSAHILTSMRGVGLGIAYEFGRAYEQPVGYSSDYSSTMIPLGCCCFTTTAAQSDSRVLQRRLQCLARADWTDSECSISTWQIIEMCLRWLHCLSAASFFGISLSDPLEALGVQLELTWCGSPSRDPVCLFCCLLESFRSANRIHAPYPRSA